MNDSTPCPRCGAPLPADAPEGLCPRCLAALPLSPETALTGDPATSARPPLTPAEIAPHFPQLEILELLGRGGMGVVYKARQRSLDRCVALKLLAPERSGDASFAERFAREAQALARLNHPGIVAVHDFGEAGGFFYLLMEFVDGVNLRRALEARHFTPEQALALVPPICEALQFAHERGIVHRDIKPENLLLDRAGHVKIADFGIAKMLDAEGRSSGEEHPAGTPAYMAPEQTEAPKKADSRADIYSLGVVIYEMLTGSLPSRQIEPPSRKVKVDVRIDEIVLRALEREPELRFQTATDLRTEVESLGAPSAPQGHTPPGPEPVAEAAPRPRRIIWRLAALLLFLCLVLPAIYVLRGGASSSGAGPSTKNAGSDSPHIDFKLTLVETPAGTHRILAHFERDTRPGLGIEVSQDVTRAPDDTGPRQGYLSWQDKTWVGEKDSRILRWTLPAELTEEEVQNAARMLKTRAQQFRQLPEGAVIEFASARHRAGWTFHLIARVLRERVPAPAPGQPHPAPPAGAVFTRELQVVAPQESRLTVEVLRSMNDGARRPVGEMLTYKTAVGSGLGVLLRWQAYGPQHPTHANRWILDLIDPQSGTIFHRIEDNLGEAVSMTPGEGHAPGPGEHAILKRGDESVILRLLHAERRAEPGEPVRAWWDVQAFVTLGAENQEGNTPSFQLPASLPPAPSPSQEEDHA